MSIWGTFVTLKDLIAALPAILKLVQTLKARIQEAETERKVADDIQTIHEAFSANDAEKLNALFKSSPSSP